MAGWRGYINGKHFTQYYNESKQLTHEKKYDLAIGLLLKIIDATEAESQRDGLGVAPGYYEQLAIIYRKLNLIEKEKQILIRFSNQKHANGALPPKLLERLRKLNADYPDL
jgi:hypothetical protein